MGQIECLWHHRCLTRDLRWRRIAKLMSKKAGKSVQKQRSLAWLEEIYFSDGHQAANAAFERMLPDADLRPYYYLRAGHGQPAQRTDTAEEDGIQYESFNAPSLWDVPYSLLRVRFEHVPKTDFMYHGGEEILIPISGRIHYHFYCNADGRPPQREILEPPLEPGSIIRINPQLPHHTWAADKNGAEAWMIIRHLSDTATSISVNSQLFGVDMHSAPRRVRTKDVKEPGRYALVAWGLAEKLRLHRERANLRIAQLSSACGIDPSHLSRIENADTNVSLETLVRIARILHISIDDLIAPSPWHCQIGALPFAKSGKRQPSHHGVLGKPPGSTHFLHPSHWSLPAGSNVDVGRDDSPIDSVVSSWIILEGRLILEIQVGNDLSPELLERGSVIHFRRAAPKKIQALEDSQIIQLIYSSACHCNPKQKKDESR